MMKNQVVENIHQEFLKNKPILTNLFDQAVIEEEPTEPLVLYTHIASEPCRAVMALLDLGNIKYESKTVDLFTGETRKP